MGYPVPPLYNPADHYVELLDHYVPANQEFIQRCIANRKNSLKTIYESGSESNLTTNPQRQLGWFVL